MGFQSYSFFHIKKKYFLYIYIFLIFYAEDQI